MRIRVDEIPDSGRFLHFHWDWNRLSQFLPPDDPFEIRLPRPIQAGLELQRRPDHVKVTGKITGTLEVACHRCLTLFSFALEEIIDLVMIREENAPDEEETELEEEELEFDFFDGEIIDIDHLVVEQIFLALPVKVLCSENCRGLCPGCGANLNEEPCRCSKDRSSSAFSKLQAVRTKLPPDTRK